MSATNLMLLFFSVCFFFFFFFNSATCWHYAPASLLFPPTSRSPEVACDFDDANCSGWQMWQVESELIAADGNSNFFPLDKTALEWPTAKSTNLYRLVTEKIGSGDDEAATTYFSIERTTRIYVMSPELRYFPLRSTGGTAAATLSICFTYYYRLMSTSLGQMKAYVLTQQNETGNFFLNLSSSSHLVWNETGRWPSTWSWLVNTVQLSLPKNTVKVAVVFYMDGGDGLVALDDVQLFNSTCNLRPVAANQTGIAPSSGAPTDTALKARIWPTTTIPYVIKLGFSTLQRDFLDRVLGDLISHTCVAFIKRRNNETEYVEFVHTSEGCTSQRIGYYGGIQRVHLADNCFDKSTISHELLHVVGLFHEHQRPDRDEYIDVLLKNVDTSYREQFTKYPSMDNRLMSVPYAYESVMHYRDNAFASRRGLKTMQPKVNARTATLGNLQGPILSDYQKVANLYCNGVVKSIIEPNLPKSPPFRPNLWDNGEIPFELDGSFSTEQKTAVLGVIQDMNVHTCLKIRPRRVNETDYVFFQLTSSECFARSGKIGGRQVVTLYSGSCFARPLLFWLLFHVAGLDAEHRRPDRDDYITVHAQNIADGHRESFQKFEAMDWRVMSVPYDINSVLHYGTLAFAKERGANTLTSKQNASLPLGNKIGATPLDYAKIVRLYNCSIQYWKDMTTLPDPPSPLRTTPKVQEQITTPPPPQISQIIAGLKRLQPSPVITAIRLQPAPPSANIVQVGALIAPLWPQRRIPYVVNELHFKIYEGRRILNVIWDFNNKTCLKFVPRTAGDVDFVEFVKNDASIVSGACRATNYGRKGGHQFITFPSAACFNETNYYIYLALLATAGLPEEHRRPDRDRYIQVLWNNIADSARALYTAYSSVDARILSVAYDINSLAHYSSQIFAKRPGLQTMIALSDPNLPLGNTNQPTDLDYQKIASLYC